MNLNSHIKSFFWKIDDSNRELLHEKAIKPFENQPLNFNDDRLNKAVGYHNEQWFHNEIVAKTKAIVEPQYGYAVEGLRTIIGPSIRTRKNLPSPIPMLKAHFLGKRQSLKKAILFDGSMGINYFHFMSDVLHKIYLLEEFTTIDCPLLVGREVYSKPFFQFLIQDSELSKYNWVPVDIPVSVEELYVARPMPYKARYWTRTKGLFVENDAAITGRRAMFINRSGTRHITNFETIKLILDEFEVEEFEPGDLSVRQQAEAFNKATHIIGIHGAGMTNVMFCNYKRTKVLELCSNNRIGTQYYWLCTALGIDWNMLLGSEAEADQSFELDPDKFRKVLEKLFAS
jgi:hypothetical protein